MTGEGEDEDVLAVERRDGEAREAAEGMRERMRRRMQWRMRRAGGSREEEHDARVACGGAPGRALS